ncbi:MAG: hypothetical protein WCG80_10235 [Spirochaetales bacterium]
MFLALALALIPGAAVAQTYQFRVDFTQTGEPVNRALFSLVNFQHLWADYGPRALETFRALKPQGSQARTETLIDQMEPVNDDGDPNHFTWSGFRTDRMYRFVNDKAGTFFSAMLSEGMEPVLLLCYNTPWLAAGGQLNEPPTDLKEWAEFAAAVVAREPRVKYLEIWNEPSGQGVYWKGSMDTYYQLFNTVADRIHRDYPGVKVGGPSVLGGQTVAMREFIVQCGSRADYFTIHLYDDDPYLTTKKLKNWNQLIQKLTGKTGPQLLVTEGDDSRISDPAEKLRYLLVRQFELLALQDQVLGFHQFSLPEYEVYGLVRPDGSPVDKNYWAYWLMRDLRGNLVASQAQKDGAPLSTNARNVALPAYVAATRDGDNLQAVLLLNDPASPPGKVVVQLTLPAVPTARQLRIDRVNGGEREVVQFRRLEPGQTSLSLELSSRFGDAFSVALSPVAGSLNLQTSATATTVLNGTLEVATGKLWLHTLGPLGELLQPGQDLGTVSVAPGASTKLSLGVQQNSPLQTRLVVLRGPANAILAQSLPFR